MGENAIRWYVGDKMIYQRRSSDGAIPSKAGMVFANIWAADPAIKAWSGLTVKGTKASAEIKYIRYTPSGDV
jgi:hypothetical protein